MSTKTLASSLLALTLASPALAAPPAWEVTDADSRVVLFPTIHVLPEAVEWKTDALEAEIEAAGEVWFEIADATSPEALATIQALVAEHGMSPDMPLSSRLSPEQLDTLKATLAELGAPLEAIDPMRPWMAATALTAASLAQSGFSGDNGVETVLGEVYADRPTRGLETADAQIALLANMA
ncbi:MAG: TraB/GumN family protein, partial [Litorimonas sp.]